MKILVSLSMLIFFYCRPGFADCSSQKINLTLGEGSTLECRALGIESGFVLEACGNRGLLKKVDGKSWFLEAYNKSWFFRSDHFDPENQRRFLEVLWLDPENQKYSYASSAQMNGGSFVRVADCQGELKVAP